MQKSLGSRLLSLTLSISLILGLGLGLTQKVSAETPHQNTPVYRFYSASADQHFFTASQAEYEALLQNPNWNYEGEAFKVYSRSLCDIRGTTPVYRFRNEANNGHFYSAYYHVYSRTDVKWTLEGSAWCMDSTMGRNTPVYRFQNISNSAMFLTASQAERDFILANLSWKYYQLEVEFSAYGN